MKFLAAVLQKGQTDSAECNICGVERQGYERYEEMRLVHTQRVSVCICLPPPQMSIA